MTIPDYLLAFTMLAILVSNTLHYSGCIWLVPVSDILFCISVKNTQTKQIIKTKMELSIILNTFLIIFLKKRNSHKVGMIIVITLLFCIMYIPVQPWWNYVLYGHVDMLRILYHYQSGIFVSHKGKILINFSFASSCHYAWSKPLISC